jgi:L-lactate dehydrogenase complex protein LldG
VTTRDEVLARIRAALGDRGNGYDAAAGAATGGYREHGELSGPDLLDLLVDRLVHYGARVHRASAGTVAGEVSTALRRRDAQRVVVSAELGVPMPDWVEVLVDGPGRSALAPAELDTCDAVITRAAVAIAETGTIILDGSAGQGRRAISLVPDYHVCIVAAEQVVHLVPEAIARLADAATRPLTWISGPSATSDIELERVQGVHGPRALDVIVIT